jgi:hypothetical protein
VLVGQGSVGGLVAAREGFKAHKNTLTHYSGFMVAYTRAERGSPRSIHAKRGLERALKVDRNPQQLESDVERSQGGKTRFMWRGAPPTVEQLPLLSMHHAAAPPQPASPAVRLVWRDAPCFASPYTHCPARSDGAWTASKSSVRPPPWQCSRQPSRCRLVVPCCTTLMGMDAVGCQQQLTGKWCRLLARPCLDWMPPASMVPRLQSYGAPVSSMATCQERRTGALK